MDGEFRVLSQPTLGDLFNEKGKPAFLKCLEGGVCECLARDGWEFE